MFWRNFFSICKSIWNLINFIRLFTINFLFTLFIILIIGLYFRFHQSSIKHFVRPSPLVMDINGSIVEKPSLSRRFQRVIQELFNYSNKSVQENSLFEIVEKLRKAKDDPNINGLILSLNNLNGAEQSSLQYIGKSIREFQKSGKPVYSIGDNYTQEQYFLASYANKIYISPNGSINLHGVSSSNLYYKSFLDKIGIKTYVFRLGNYKSAVEPFLRNNMSEEVRKEKERIVKQLWKNYLFTISKNRNLKVNQLFPETRIFLKDLQLLNGDTAKYAISHKLADEISTCPEALSKIMKKFSGMEKRKNISGISIYDYKTSHLLDRYGNVKVIFVNGIISDSPDIKINSDLASEQEIIEQIRDAKLNPNIKAVIFRINSPGGSVRASEAIRSELISLKNTGKPIVVSMSNVAASGGYWISTPANYILAENNTLTGSIGIFGIVHTMENFLNSLGIYEDGVSTSPLENMYFAKPLSQELQKLFQLNIKHGYRYFISLVAKSRNKTVKEIDKIGRGHVWIGKEALQNGLIDQIGDFDDAVAKAVELAKLKEYRITWNIKKKNWIDFVLEKDDTSIFPFFRDIYRNIWKNTESNITSFSRDEKEIKQSIVKLYGKNNQYALYVF